MTAGLQENADTAVRDELSQSDGRLNKGRSPESAGWGSKAEHRGKLWDNTI